MYALTADDSEVRSVAHGYNGRPFSKNSGLSGVSTTGVWRDSESLRRHWDPALDTAE